MSRLLERIVEGDLCCGCGLCKSILPEATVEWGFRDGHPRPRQTGDLDPQQADRLARVCPGYTVRHRPGTATDPAYDTNWGLVREIRVGHALDETLRWKGASGGGLSAIAAYLLDSGQVDGVYQVRVSATDPLRNEMHISRSIADVAEAAGSRYAPSSPLRDVETLLAGGERLAFIGKPCDVVALRALGRDDPRVARTFPFVGSFFCAGMPSEYGTLEIVRRAGLAHEEVTSFRYRGEGWPGKAKVESASAPPFEMTYRDAWGGILSRHLQFRCKICPDGVGEQADFVCADAWYGGESGYPQFEERDGRSLVLSRTELGSAVLEGAVRSGFLSVEPLNACEIALMQPHQKRRKSLVPSRLLVLRTVGALIPRYEGLHLKDARRQSPFRMRARSYLGTLRRLVRQKIGRDRRPA